MSKDKKAIKTAKGVITAVSESIIPADYAAWLAGLKNRISSARQRAALSVNQELVRLYHHIGTEILERQTRQGWGAKVIDRLAGDLREAFPEMKGFSSSNLKYMRFFAQMCPDLRIGQQPADQLPWFHLVTILTKISDDVKREWYAGHLPAHHRADRTGTGQRAETKDGVGTMKPPTTVAHFKAGKIDPFSGETSLNSLELEGIAARMDKHLKKMGEVC